MSTSHTNNNSGLAGYVRKLAKTYWVYGLSFFVVAFSAAFFGVLVDYKVKEIIDAIHGGASQVNTLVFFFILYKIVWHVAFFVRRLFDIKYFPSLIADVVSDMYKKVTAHSLHWFDSHLSGEIANKIVDFQESISGIIKLAPRVFTIFIMLFISVIFLWHVSIINACVIIIFIAIYVPVLLFLLGRQSQLQEELSAARHGAVGVINDSITNIFGVKVIGSVAAELEHKIFPAIFFWKVRDKAARKYDAYFVDSADTILVSLMSAAQIIFLAKLYQSGQITAGDFAFISMVTISIHRFLGDLLEMILFDINPRLAVLKYSYRVIAAPSDVKNLPNAQELSLVQGDVMFKDVEFAYGNSPAIFSNFNLHIKPGERVGIVGTSGAGKTTLVKCLLRYFDVRSGGVFVDGHNIRQLTQESLRANISIIPQDITMFHRTILENLRLAKPDASLLEIERACQRARIHDDIKKMEHGYETVVGERGVKLSGGQRQRIAIARAILKDAPILILDEATSALDTPTELLIQESINDVLKSTKATTIVIAHRLSTLQKLDRILVFKEGEIVEDGTHQELLARGGMYKALWAAQTHGFLPEDEN